jgi:hypothetical protein|nr:MAG TPA: Protein of unknown function (DUF2833) [Caudoviricetes sp.]
MIELVKFNPVHLRHLTVQQDQRYAAELFGRPDYQELLLMGDGYTVLHDGRVVGCGGIWPMTDYMGRAWALVGQEAGPVLLAASRVVRHFLTQNDYVRLDTPVRRDFTNGHRWARLLGFVNETPERGMKYYGYDGGTYDLYALYPQELKHGQS